MMSEEFELKLKHESVLQQKKTYTKPVFTCFGKVRLLTQAGATGANEGSNSSTKNMAMSERSVKENIVRVGDHPLGIGLYLFDYRHEYRERFGAERQFGVMVDEVEIVMPKAVVKYHDGYKMVDYAMLGIERCLH